jgi:hypothetical protein
MTLWSGRQERLPYSLSRWTDLPAAKWDWFKAQLAAGEMMAFDPRTAVPGKWSLLPEHTMGLVFWTKNPENLILDHSILTPYRKVIHMTLTGWEEVEKGAPDIQEGLALMKRAVATFGPENVTWRFSPVPMVEDVLGRFEYMAPRIAKMGLKEVYVAFLQENDLMPETRARRTRVELLKQMAQKAHLRVLLCNEDRSLQDEHMKPNNLASGICESGERFAVIPPVDPTNLLTSVLRQERALPPREGCGCALAVDPFTINETCTMGCSYCYAADKSLASKKRNTTKVSLPLV